MAHVKLRRLKCLIELIQLQMNRITELLTSLILFKLRKAVVICISVTKLADIERHVSKFADPDIVDQLAPFLFCLAYLDAETQKPFFKRLILFKRHVKDAKSHLFCHVHQHEKYQKDLRVVKVESIDKARSIVLLNSKIVIFEPDLEVLDLLF